MTQQEEIECLSTLYDTVFDLVSHEQNLRMAQDEHCDKAVIRKALDSWLASDAEFGAIYTLLERLRTQSFQRIAGAEPRDFSRERSARPTNKIKIHRKHNAIHCIPVQNML